MTKYNWKTTPERIARSVARQMIKIRCPNCGLYMNSPAMARHRPVCDAKYAKQAAAPWTKVKP